MGAEKSGPEFGADFSFGGKKEKRRPEKLYRAITVDPAELTLGRLKQILVPGSANKDDATKIGDGNELGVYMTTNKTMADSVYSRGGGGVGAIETPPYDDSRTTVRRIELPSCGITYEIDSTDLPIREPEITQALQGHYNNGYEGEEWIADAVPPEKYKVIKLTLSRYANDNKTFKVQVEDNSDEGIQAAIDKIKEEYERIKLAAETFRAYLLSLTEKERLNGYKNKRKMEELGLL